MTVSSSRRRRGGFTLIEVLLVLVILVTLASLAVTTFDGIRKRAMIHAATVQIGLFENQLELYKMSIGDYPLTEQGLQALVQCPDGLYDPMAWDGPYTEVIPFDPWGSQYQYAYPSRTNEYKYDLWSLGPDMVDNTQDDIGNWVAQ